MEYLTKTKEQKRLDLEPIFTGFTYSLYTDGGCSGNGQKDLEKRKMIAVVADQRGDILVEKHQEGGSNNIAEFLAIKEALLWANNNKINRVQILTDSFCAVCWMRRIKESSYLKMNDGNMVRDIKATIDAIRKDIKVWVKQIPREQNLAGHYIEEKYGL